MKQTPFRNWLRNKWYEHLEEINSFGEPAPTYNSDFYFKTYKWWLKREYRHETSS